jgi:hypothetical protein
MILTALLAAATPALAQAATAAQPVHVRGTIVSSSGNSIVVNTGSVTQKITFSQKTRLVGVVNSSLDKVTAGDFIGTAVAEQPDGSIKALEVHIFPPSLKGSGEGYYAWDKQPSSIAATGSAENLAQPKSMMANATVANVGDPKSMMANATVADVGNPKSMMANATVQHVGAASGGRTVQLVYKGGEKSVYIPPDVPVVAFQVGTKSLLTPGAHVFVNATRTGSGNVAKAINVGEHGVVPPM